MRWFKHMTDAQDDARLGQLFELHGHRGVLIYWWILEKVAARMDESDLCNLQTTRTHWAKMLRTYEHHLDKIVASCRDLGLILTTSTGDLLDISCPKLLKIRARKQPIERNRSAVEVDREVDRDVEVEEEPPKPPRGPTPFDRFWKIYPKKVGKKAAARSWDRAKINGKLEEILKAVEAQKTSEQWLKDGGQFIPNPATWINQGRWDDEPTKAPDWRNL